MNAGVHKVGGLRGSLLDGQRASVWSDEMFWVGTVWGADSTQGCKYGSTTQGKYLRPPKCTLRNGSNSKLHVVYLHHSGRMTEKKKTEERGNPGLLEASVNLEVANPSAIFLFFPR